VAAVLGKASLLSRFRVVVKPLAKTAGPWRDTRDEAVEDAIDMGLAERDPVRDGQLFWHPLAAIEEDKDER
jgi:hypothetical protein